MVEAMPLQFQKPFTIILKTGSNEYPLKYITIYLTPRRDTITFKTVQTGGAWEVQSVKHLTLDFCSGYDLRVLRSMPPLSPSPHSHALSLCPQNK